MARTRKGSRAPKPGTADRASTGSSQTGAVRNGSGARGRQSAYADSPATVTNGSGNLAGAAPAQRGGFMGRFTWKRVLIGLGVVVLLLIIGGAGYAYWVVQRAMPTVNGSASLPGLSAPVTVTRDTYGVPHIVGATVADVYAAQGYVHAQDRLFQMFYYRQLGAGKLAEAFGPTAADADKFLRTIGMRRAAEAEWQQATPEVRTALEAYAKGVNAFLHTHSDSLPIEFNLLGMKVADWQPVDSLSFAKVMAWDLSGNWDQELLNADLVAKLGPQRAAQLLPSYPAEGPVVVPGASSGSTNAPSSPELQAFNQNVRPWLPATGVAGLGSNNWVVDGTKSTTGKPLLSNDPHLTVQNPSIWYQLHLSTSDGKLDAAGFGFAAAPGIVTGHNQNITWGVTNVEGDVQDLFIEKLDPTGHPGQYQAADGWKPLQVLTETILVKGDQPITQTVRITGHGPLLSDALTAISATIGSTVKDPLALEWTAAKPGHLMEALLGLQQAQNWQDFRAALSKWSVPGQNFVYADKQGNIGYQMTGEQPIRKKGNGMLPVPGSTGEYDWSGYVPFDSLPRSYNPPEHYIATANNKNFGPDYKFPIQATWAPPWRISRILEMLKAKDKLSVADFQTMLTDTHSLMARKVAPVIAALKPSDARAQAAVKMLSTWDGNLTADSVPATIYEVTVQKALSQTFSDDLGPDLFQEYLGGSGSSVLRAFELLIDKPDDPYWDRTATAAHENRDAILGLALNDAMADLTSGLGDDMTTWQWGKVHTVTPHHTFGSQPIISGVFNLTALPMGGDGTTVAVSGFELLAPYAATTHQSYRMIVDVGDWTKSLGIFATGESGQPYSKHWGDMYAAWNAGTFNPILYDRSQIQAASDGVLTLNP